MKASTKAEKPDEERDDIAEIVKHIERHFGTFVEEKPPGRGMWHARDFWQPRTLFRQGIDVRQVVEEVVDQARGILLRSMIAEGHIPAKKKRTTNK